MCEGLYFIGGEDWSHWLYADKKHPETFEAEIERDHIEIDILKRALKDRKPVLGICRGSQGLAIASGGTLIQHLPDMYPEENHNPNKNYDGLLFNPKHEVLIERIVDFIRFLTGIVSW